MLFGEHSPAIDSQYRISVPAKFRVELGEQFVIVCKLDNSCLRIYSQSAWDEYLASLKKQLPRGKYEKMTFQFFRRAVQAVPDSLGRVRVPREIWECVGLDFGEDGNREIVVVGCGEFGEIWSKPRYDEYVNDLDLDELSALIDECGI